MYILVIRIGIINKKDKSPVQMNLAKLLSFKDTANRMQQIRILGHGAGILGHSMTEMKATGA